MARAQLDKDGGRNIASVLGRARRASARPPASFRTRMGAKLAGVGKTRAHPAGLASRLACFAHSEKVPPESTGKVGQG
jgi:hypothetical protein